MEAILVVVLVLVAIAMIGVVLIQRSEGGALGIGGPTGLVSARGTASMLTRATGVLAALFIVICLVLAILSGGQIRKERSIMGTESEAVPAALPATGTSQEPEAPSVPEAAGELIVIPEEETSEDWSPEPPAAAPAEASPPGAESGAETGAPVVPEAQ